MRILYVIGKSEYDSTIRFMKELAEAMSLTGWEVDVLNGTELSDYQKTRQECLGKRYDAILTINAMFMETDLCRDILRETAAVFCTYLMDHPMIHQERLKKACPRCFVLCPDRNHVAYIDRYMKQIWATAFLPHAGCRGRVQLPYEERDMDISFFGSYQSPDEIRKEFDNYPEPMKNLIISASGELVSHPEKTLEECLTELFGQQGIFLSEEEFAEVMGELRIVDRYVRSYFRDQVIRTLVLSKIPVDVFGHGWELFLNGKNADEAAGYLHVHEPVSYEESLEIIGASKISLNVMPWFKDGSHDRVMTAMLNGAVCLTDSSAYLSEQFQEDENIYFYSLKGIRYLPNKVRSILKNTKKSREVAENGCRTATERHTWANRAAEIVDYLEGILEPEALAAAADRDRICCGQSGVTEILVKNDALIHHVKKTVRSFRRQEYLYAMRQTTAMLDKLTELLPELLSCQELLAAAGISVSEAKITLLLQEILEAQMNMDHVLLADRLELELLPFLQSVQSSFSGVCRTEETIGEKYRIEPTSGGMYTLAVQDPDGIWRYQHTNGDVWEEADILAESWFQREISHYVVYGLGLGYHVQELLEMDEVVHVTVLEPDAEVIELAGRYGVLEELKESGRADIVPDKDGRALLKWSGQMGKEDRFVVHYPSMLRQKDSPYYGQLEEYFIQYSSAQTQLTRLVGNFLRNKKYFDHEVTELRNAFEGQTVYMIAAGPSLDKNIEELRNVRDKGIILATGTVFKKLIKAGIHPDYVIIIDAGGVTYGQTRDIQDTDVPLLFLSTVYYQIPENYPGRKYAVFQEGLDLSEQYAGEKGYPLYQSGGSVVTSALELCIRFACARVVFVGLDLAYTGQKDHASGTELVREVEQGNLEVEDIYGRRVQTAKNLDIYRRWIENRLRKEDALPIEFIDATEGGAKIAGTRICKLKEILSY